MSFLDNLEDNLKSLESREEPDSSDTRRRERERAAALASAPWAERLKDAPFAPKLMQLATIAGRPRRMKVNLLWIGTSFRLEARGHRLELRPGPKGISAVFMNGAEEIRRKPVDLAGDPQALVTEWIVLLDEQKRIDDEQAALAAQQEEDLE